MSAFLAGRYDLGWDLAGAIGRTDWVQIKDLLKQRRPGLRTAEFVSNVETHISMRTDQKPWSDVRVRQAVSMAVDRQGILDAIAEGVGIFNPAVPTAFKDWSVPIAELGEGARYFKYDPAEAKRLLAAAGYPTAFPRASASPATARQRSSTRRSSSSSTSRTSGSPRRSISGSTAPSSRAATSASSTR